MKKVVCMFALLGWVVACCASAEPVSTATGTLEINGKAVPIKYAYAFQHDNEEGFLDGPELRIAVTDREIDPALLGGVLSLDLDAAAKKKDVCGLLLKFDPKKESREINGTLLYAPSDPRAPLVSFTRTDDDTCLKKLEIKDGKVTGILDEKAPEKSPSEDMPKYGYHIEFTAAIRTNDPITARFKGAEAVKSPQAQAVIAYEKALREGRIEDAKKLATPERFSKMGQAIEQMGKDVFMEQVKQFIPDTAAREKQITDVIVRGKHAVVVMVEKGSRTPGTVIESGGGWIVE